MKNVSMLDVHDQARYLNAHDAVEWINCPMWQFDADVIMTGQRIGELWFNLLPRSDQRQLRASSFYPYHKDDWPSVILALAYLLLQDGNWLCCSQSGLS